MKMAKAVESCDRLFFVFFVCCCCCCSCFIALNWSTEQYPLCNNEMLGGVCVRIQMDFIIQYKKKKGKIDVESNRTINIFKTEKCTSRENFDLSDEINVCDLKIYHLWNIIY